MTRNSLRTSTRLLTVFAAILMIAGSAAAQLPAVPGVGGVPDPAGVAGTATGLSPVDNSASADIDGSSVSACASAGTSTGAVQRTADAAKGIATSQLPVGVPATPGVPVNAPAAPQLAAGADLCADSDDPAGTAMGAAAEAQEQAGDAQGFVGTLIGWAQGLRGLIPF